MDNWQRLGRREWLYQLIPAAAAHRHRTVRISSSSTPLWRRFPLHVRLMLCRGNVRRGLSLGLVSMAAHDDLKPQDFAMVCACEAATP